MSRTGSAWDGFTQPTSAWQRWPGAGLPRSAHPPGTVYVGHNLVPQYPLEATCTMLGEHDPYFPVTWHFIFLGLVAGLFYVVWPIYVLRHLIRKSVYGGDDLYQANHDAYQANIDALSKRKDEVSEE